MRILESVSFGLTDPKAWDEFVAQDPSGHLLQTWAWGELKGAFGWTPVRLAVERDGALVAGAQILYRRAGPLSIGYIPKGPVLLDQSEETSRRLWRAIHHRSRRMGTVLLKVEPPWRDEETERHDWLLANRLTPSPECIQPRRTIVVDLQGTEDEILARMKSKWRYNIRLSIRRGVRACQSNSAMAAFYRLMEITGERDGFGVHTQAYYSRALELFVRAGRAALLMADFEGEPLAGLMAFAFNGQACYMYGASSNSHRELMPNHQLQWRAMQWARDQGCTSYDLWGITDTDAESPTAELSGVERFKAGFGGEVVRYVGAYDRVYSRPLNWLVHKAWDLRKGVDSTG